MLLLQIINSISTFFPGISDFEASLWPRICSGYILAYLCIHLSSFLLNKPGTHCFVGFYMFKSYGWILFLMSCSNTLLLRTQTYVLCMKWHFRQLVSLHNWSHYQFSHIRVIGFLLICTNVSYMTDGWMDGWMYTLCVYASMYRDPHLHRPMLYVLYLKVMKLCGRI
jgi:hypothetical protein